MHPMGPTVLCHVVSAATQTPATQAYTLLFVLLLLAVAQVPKAQHVRSRPAKKSQRSAANMRAVDSSDEL
jgi:hypothetical protein